MKLEIGLYYIIIIYIIIYLIGLSSYLIDFIILQSKEKYWNNAPQDKFLKKIKTILRLFKPNITFSTYHSILNKYKMIYKLNTKFRIYCFRSGLKNRMDKIINKY